jgi:hypothetical protein
MMVLAGATVGGDLSAWVEITLILGLSVVALSVVKTLLLGDNQASSRSRPRQRFVHKRDLFDPIRHTEEPAPSRRPGDKRRSLRRHGHLVTVLISDARKPKKPLRGLVLDRSRGGLYLSVPRRIDEGSELTVCTPDFPDHVAPVRLLVRHCKQKGREWRIGCQFVDELPWSVLLLFG